MEQHFEIAPNGDINLWLRPGAQAESTRSVPIVVEMDARGRWVRGFEVLSPGFLLPRAIEGIGTLEAPGRGRPGVVTYDPEANAAFFYLWERTPPVGGPPTHYVEIDSEWVLAADGRLVRIRIPAGLLGADPQRVLAALASSDEVP